jgi:hypothetical protein
MNRASSSAREHWRQIIGQQESSGLSVARFCRERQIVESSLFAWKRRLAREPQASPVFVQFTPATPASVPQPNSAAGSSGGAIDLHLDQGRHLLPRPGFDGPTLAEVLAVLSAESARADDASAWLLLRWAGLAAGFPGGSMMMTSCTFAGVGNLQ